VSETELFLKFFSNNYTELYIIILINKESSVITVIRRNFLTVNTIFIDISTVDISTVNTIITDIENIIERAELLKLTDITEFNLIFLTIIKAAVIS
ncbi:hypothetical protein EMPG_10047, partial [Blastomyces silverae]